MPDTDDVRGYPEIETIGGTEVLRRYRAHADLVAALKGLLHAFLRETSEGDGVHEQDVPAVDAATAALKLAEAP